MPQEFWDKLIAPDEARAIFLPQIEPLSETELLPTERGLGRFLAEEITSPMTLPMFRRSTVDGYAVLASDLTGASLAQPTPLRLAGEVPMGSEARFRIKAGEAAVVHTGGMVPDGADAVVMLEQTSQQNGTVFFEVPARPNQNIIQVGEDIKQGHRLLPAGHRLREQDIGGLLAVGVTSVSVVRRPRAAIFSTGDEVVPPSATPRLGQVRDINSYTIEALAREAGATTDRWGILPDHYETMLAAVQRVYQDGVNMIVLSAGSSVSARDLTPRVFNALGEPGVLIHGLATRPGKPTLFGLAGRCVLIGLPGNPVSAYVQFLLSGVPALYRLQGGSVPKRAILTLKLAGDVESAAWREDYIPMRFVHRGGELFADPIMFKSNLIFTLVNADGLIKVPIGRDRMSAGELVEVRLF